MPNDKATKFFTHVALYCRDVNKTKDWYCQVFGMNVNASAPGRFAALSFGYKHHDLALVQAPAEFQDPQPPRVGLYHFAVDTGSFEESMRIFERAKALESEFVKAIDHRIGNGIYVRDPDGNMIELWNEAHATMDEAVASLHGLKEEFEVNPIGFPLDIDATVAAKKPVRKPNAAPPSPTTHR